MKAYIKAIVLAMLCAKALLARTVKPSTTTSNIVLSTVTINLPYHNQELKYICQGRLFDYSNDNYPGLVVWGCNGSTWTPAPVLAFKNIGGTFLPVTDPTVTGISTTSAGDSLIADFNNNGIKELVIEDAGIDTGDFSGSVCKVLEPTLYGGVTRDTTLTPSVPNYTHSAAIADIDKDGYMDFLEVNMIFNNFGLVQGTVLCINDKKGHLVESPGRLPSDIENNPQAGWNSGAFIDANNDGYPDIVLGGGYDGWKTHYPNILLINDGTGHYKDRYYLPPRILGDNSMADYIAPITINGRHDLLVATNLWDTYGGSLCAVQVLKNNGNNTFTDVSSNSGIVFTPDEIGLIKIIVADLNNDGIQDVICFGNSTTCGQFIRVFLGKSDGTFNDVTQTYYPNNQYRNVAAVDVADVDNNGYLDLVTLENTWTNQPTLTITYTVPVNNTKLHTLAKPLLEKLPTITTKEDDLLKLISKSQ